MMKLLITIFALISMNFTFADERCDVKFTKTSICANIDWIYGPYLDQYNSAKISLSENDKVVTIKVIPWMVMSNHEHGSRPVVLTKTGDSEFLIEKAYFMGGMDGSWFFKIQLNDSTNNLIEEARYHLEFKK
ncbi:MAG: hypothetical protein Q7U04_12245 [Bacteriovorax sp.]|nr:hypothetical protein [Bacteriovorax sp.]